MYAGRHHNNSCIGKVMYIGGGNDVKSSKNKNGTGEPSDRGDTHGP
jgi:hypothetical protein